MIDWRIKFYTDTIIGYMNDRIMEHDYTNKLINKEFVDKKLKRIQKNNKDLDEIECLKLLLKEVKEGKHDKNYRKTGG